MLKKKRKTNPDIPLQGFDIMILWVSPMSAVNSRKLKDQLVRKGGF